MMQDDPDAPDTGQPPFDGRPLFLEPRSYRRRRMAEVARLMPFLTAAGVLLPVLFAPRVMSGAAGVLWFFGLWFAVIVATAALNRYLPRHAGQDGGDVL